MKKGQASRTAEYVALFRAIESALPSGRRLFEDPYAEHFLSPPLALVARLARLPGVADLVSAFIDRRWAGARSWVVARTRLIDDRLIDALTRGIGQVVILGAGFDSRAYRLSRLRGVPIFEVDHPDTLARKQRVLAAASIDVPSNIRFVATDFHVGDLDAAVAEAGYSAEVPTFLLWEGVTAYLTASAVDATLRWCARAASGSELLFTYVHRAILDDPGAFAGTGRLSTALQAAGERWTFGLDPAELRSYLRDRGLDLEEDVGSADYSARYLPRLSERIRDYDFFRLAIAKVP
ncbi:MAG: SAM-dependent methyltransferase [Polyangiales bacterium]